jgi:hypothetical protein
MKPSRSMYADATPEPQTPGLSIPHSSVATPEFAPIIVNIVYSLRNPVDGVQFVLPTDSYPYVRVFFTGQALVASLWRVV